MTTPMITGRDILAATEAILDEDGPDAVTMRRVGERSGYSAMAIYRHHANREALLTAVADRALLALSERFDAAQQTDDTMAAIRATLDAMIDLAVERPHTFDVVFTARRDGATELTRESAQSPTLSLVVRLLRAGVERGVLRLDDPVEAAIGFAGQVQGLFSARYAQRIIVSDDQFRAMCHRCIERNLHGILV